VAFIPDEDNATASIWSFTRGTLVTNPFIARKTKPKSKDEFFAVLQAEKSGDIVYDDAEGGTIVVISRQYMRLGAGLLADLPAQVEATMVSGGFMKADAGERYLVRTVDNRFAVFRVLAVGRNGMCIQCIYQPDGSTSFLSAGSVLDRKVGNTLLPYRSMRDIVDHLRKETRLRVCFESLGSEKPASKASNLVVQNATVKSLLDAATQAAPQYVWQHVEGSDVVCIFPARDAKLAQTIPESVAAALGEKQSWIEIVKRLRLSEQGIQFPPVAMAIGPYHVLPEDRQISVSAKSGDRIWSVLDKVCRAYGGGMYFDIWYDPDGKVRLYFYGDHRLKSVGPPVNRPSPRPSK
jgi:hypothetical protein